MQTTIRRFLSAALVCSGLGVAATPAWADIIVLNGVNNAGTDNVLLNDATNVPVVTGTINAGAFTALFESDGGNLDAEASGQAVVTAADGHDPFVDIRFYLQDAFFTRAVFNLNSAVDGLMMIRVTGINIDGGLFEDVFTVDDNGENFFTVDAINGQYIHTIALIAQGDVEFQDLRQVRIGGATTRDELPVPEPGLLALLGSGVLGLALKRRQSA